jgi:hypothetical protein
MSDSNSVQKRASLAFKNQQLKLQNTNRKCIPKIQNKQPKDEDRNYET